MLHSIVTACSFATLDTFRTFWTIAAMHATSSHICDRPSLLDDIVSITFNDFSIIDIIDDGFGFKISFATNFIAPSWTSFDLARFGIEIRIKHDSLASIIDDSFSGHISLSNSSNKFFFFVIMSFDSASFAIVSKTLANVIFDSVLPCYKT